jgi:hypothetical protein
MYPVALPEQGNARTVTLFRFFPITIPQVLTEQFPVLSSCPGNRFREAHMNSLIYLVGLIVIIMAVLSLVGLR